MLRIDSSLHSDHEIVVTLSGQVHREYLAELERVITRVHGEGRAIRFDLRDVGLVDRDAVAFFATGPGRLVPLENCPRYLEAWLESEGRSIHDPS